MKLAVISFTRAGSLLCRRLVEELQNRGVSCEGYMQRKYLEDDGLSFCIHPLEESVKAWTGRQFSQADGLIYIGAAGIAVRSIAPYLKDKMTDPAVVVADEAGTYVISLLSGHLGGANDLTRRLADILGARPVITTASDVNGKTAIDVWAASHGLKIGSREQAKQVAAAILEDEPVGFFCDEPMELPVPEGCVRNMECRKNVRVTVRSDHGKKTDGQKIGEYRTAELHLIPQILYVGIGCKKGTEAEKIEKEVLRVLDACGLYQQAVAGISSIDLKKEEAGMKNLCASWKLPFQTFSAAELEQAPGKFSESDFVRKITGTGNVCERAAVLAAGPGAELIVTRQAADGVTIAIAKRMGQEKTFR